MQRVRRIVVPRDAALRTLDLVQAPGADGLEALVLWLGRFQGAVAEITEVWQPQQNSRRTKEGLYLHIGAEELARLNELLYRTGQTLIVQLHTHPSLAYHSALDDAKPVVTEEGSFSIVVPFFGFTALNDLTSCAVYRIENGTFVRVPPSEHAQLFEFRA